MGQLKKTNIYITGNRPPMENVVFGSPLTVTTEITDSEENKKHTWYKLTTPNPSSGNIFSYRSAKIEFTTTEDNIEVEFKIKAQTNWDGNVTIGALDYYNTNGVIDADYSIAAIYGNWAEKIIKYQVPTKGKHFIQFQYAKSSNNSGDGAYICAWSNLNMPISEVKSVYVENSKIQQMNVQGKDLFEYGFDNTISWETLKWDKSNNSYTYNTRGKLKLTYAGGYTYLINSPEYMKNKIDYPKFHNINSYSGNSYNLTYKLDLSDWDTSNIKYMTSMFSNCYSLTYINLSKFNTSNVIYMNNMFSNCYSLTYIDLSRFNTSNVTAIREMFAGTGKINMIDMSKWDLSKLTDDGFKDVFKGSYCENIKLPNMNLKKKFNTYYGQTFKYLYELKSLQAPELVNSYTNNIKFLFAGDHELYDVDMLDWDFSNVTYAYGAFYGTKISNVSANLVNAKDSIYSMFRESYADSINISNLEISNKVTDTMWMFADTKSTSIDFVDNNGNTKFDTSGVTNMSYMFRNSKNLTTINGLNKLNTSNLKDIGAMFYNCNSLTSLDLSDWDTSNINNVTSSLNTNDKTGLFEYCFKLVDLKLPRKFITAKVNNISGMFNNTRLTSLDLSDWDTSRVYNMRHLFHNDTALERLNLVGWDASSLSATDWCFANCPELTTLIDGHESEPDVTIFNGLKYNISLSDNSKLNYESIYALFRGVSADGDGYYKNIYLPKVMQGKLDATKVKIATDKGWTITYK